MMLVDVNWHPSDRQLRQFGLMSLPLLPLAGWVFLGFRQPGDWPTVAWRTMEGLGVAGLVLAALALFKPRAVGPLFVALSLVTFPIGLVVGEITLLLMYWLVFVPVGVIFRLVGRDALNRRSGKHAATYWKAKHTTGTIERYFHQY